jgi:uncharacterized protein (TIGR00251 family)
MQERINKSRFLKDNKSLYKKDFLEDSSILKSDRNKENFPNSFFLRVKPNSNKTQFFGFDKNINTYRLEVKEAAEENRANIAIIKFFKKQFGLVVKIKTGKNSKKKLIEII